MGWGGEVRAELGVCEAGQWLLCVLEAGGGSWPGHSASILSWATAALRPELEQPGQGRAGLGRQACSCCVWFPLGPGDLDKRVAFID